jgi:hypothetical protein
MKTDILKKLIKEAVKEAIHEELKDILFEAFKSNKQSIKESYIPSDNRTISFTSQNVPKNPVDTKKAYMDILNDMSQGPKSGFNGDFKVNGPVNTMTEGSSLPDGQLGLDQIMNLIKK